METEWVIFDTGDGPLLNEISAQRMRGCEKVGNMFHVKITSGVDEVTGTTPKFHAICSFLWFANGAKLTADNLNVDFVGKLWPTIKREVIPGRFDNLTGFSICDLAAKFKLAEGSNDHSLSNLRRIYGLNTPVDKSISERDVASLVDLFERVLKAHLEKFNLKDYKEFEMYANDSADSRYRSAGDFQAVKSEFSKWGEDSWQYLQCHQPVDQWNGPLTAKEVVEAIKDVSQYWVWREGMDTPVKTVDCEAFLELSTFRGNSKTQKYVGSKSVGELIGLLRGITADGRLTNKEFENLQDWLNGYSFWLPGPLDEIKATVGQIFKDGKVSEEEKNELYQLIINVVPSDS